MRTSAHGVRESANFTKLGLDWNRGLSPIVTYNCIAQRKVPNTSSLAVFSTSPDTYSKVTKTSVVHSNDVR